MGRLYCLILQTPYLLGSGVIAVFRAGENLSTLLYAAFMISWHLCYLISQCLRIMIQRTCRCSQSSCRKSPYRIGGPCRLSVPCTLVHRDSCFLLTLHLPGSCSALGISLLLRTCSLMPVVHGIANCSVVVSPYVQLRRCRKENFVL